MTFILSALTAATLALGSASASASPQGDTIDHARDFDFLAGKWHVHHWRLKERLANNHDWVEFDGTCEMWPTMDGKGNVDDNVIGLPSGPYRAMGIRGYDPKTQTWAIWWLDGRNPQKIEPPVFGNFESGVGVFEGDDTFNGKPIKVRFTWTKIDTDRPHWEQAFSPDGGKSWEVNWRMDLTRMK